MKFADKVQHFSSSIFVQLEHKKAEVEKLGMETINLSVGTPDMPPPECVMSALEEAVQDSGNMKYAIVDLPELISAAQQWYSSRYGVELAPDEICSLSGSQDGLSHLPLCLLNPGDLAIVPNPGYPIFQTGPLIASAKLYYTPLHEESGFLPDLESIPPQVARDAKLMIFSYPMNPLAKMAPPEFFERIISFARKHDIILVHDNAYSELTYDGKECGSFLSFQGAKDVGVEFNSLSKSYNMTGMRMSFALGNKDIISVLRSFKSNIDYGIFLPVQRAAIAALEDRSTFTSALRAVYSRRRDTLIDSFAAAGWNLTPPDATMFVWARLPKGFSCTSFDFCMRLIEKAGVVTVPGTAFGSLGEGFVRIAMVQNEQELTQAAARLQQSGALVP